MSIRPSNPVNGVHSGVATAYHIFKGTLRCLLWRSFGGKILVNFVFLLLKNANNYRIVFMWGNTINFCSVFFGVKLTRLISQKYLNLQDVWQMEKPITRLWKMQK